MAELELLSPLHVGDGERLTDFDYIQEGSNQEGSKLYVYMFDRVIDLISQEPPQRRENMLLQLKGRGEGVLNWLFRSFPDLKRKIEPLYILDIKRNLQGRQVESFIKSLGKPYLPGSELKGALRVLFLAGVLMEDANLRNWFMRELANKSHDRKELEKLQGELEKRVFYPENESDAKYDLFKALEISDSEPVEYQNLYVETPELVGSNRKLNACEALKEGTKLKISVKLNQNTLWALKKAGRYAYIHYFDNFWEKLKEFSQRFYGALLQEEMDYFRRKGKASTVQHLISLQTKLNSDRILLRLGKHEGYLSTTVMLVVKRQDPQLFNKVFKASQHNAREETNKTRRITSDGKTFGWVLLKV